MDWGAGGGKGCKAGHRSKSIYFWRDAVLTRRGGGENIRGPHAGCGNGQEVCNQELLEERMCVHHAGLCTSITTKSDLAGLLRTSHQSGVAERATNKLLLDLLVAVPINRVNVPERKQETERVERLPQPPVCQRQRIYKPNNPSLLPSSLHPLHLPLHLLPPTYPMSVSIDDLVSSFSASHVSQEAMDIATLQV